MVRAPCCEKMGLKKGPWTAEEDRILINFVNEFGHGNWRALPKQAGLLRCGKSCRLRWVNYLDPNIKRGNFSREEEEDIIKLHEMLGNRWSAIAARLPGRTDNEIKNVWHTHLKKRVDKSKNTQEQPNKPYHKNKNQLVLPKKEQEPASSPSRLSAQSPQHSGGSEISSFTTTTTTTSTSGSSGGGDHHDNMVLEGFPELDEGFWSDVFSGENTGDFVAAGVDPLTEFQYSSLEEQVGNVFGCNTSTQDINMDFWLNVLTSDGELPEF